MRNDWRKWLGWLMKPVARGAALFLAGFTLLNMAGDWLSPGFDSNIWWVDLRMLPGWMGHLFLGWAAMGLLIVAMNWLRNVWVRRVVLVVLGGLLCAVVGNAVMFYVLIARGVISPGVWVPLSLFLALVIGGIWWSAAARGRMTRAQAGIFVLTFAVSLVAFPLAQMVCFGETDYRRPADAIVVFGALTNKDGTPSQALADRVNTAIALYKEGYAPVLIFSGGPSAGPISEPQAMRNLALSQGVPDSAIVLDEAGVHTDATVANTVRMFQERGYRKVLAVSHFYHLPRIKMAYARELRSEKNHVEVLTVPAKESSPLVAMPHFVLREVAALWVYYLRPLWGAG